MTVVGVWVERSFGFPRIAALADSRASTRQRDGSFKTLSDTTVKLFAIPIRAYQGDSLIQNIGAWTCPYLESTIGLGFAGSCFEAMTLIAHISRALGSLFASIGESPKPTRDGIIELIARLARGYFQGHSGENNPKIWLVVFGYEEKAPWIAKITASKGTKVRISCLWASDDTFVTVGQDDVYAERAKEWRKRVTRQRQKMVRRPLSDCEDALFERDLSLARLDIMKRTATEGPLIMQIKSEFADTIGGVAQRLELGLHEDKVVAGWTKDISDYLGGAVCNLGREGLLTPTHISEDMGRHEQDR